MKPYSLLRKSKKWYKKLFLHLLDLAIYNAYILFKNIHEADVTFLQFRLNLIRQIIEKHGLRTGLNSSTRPKSQGHKLVKNETNSKGLIKYKNCKLCYQFKTGKIRKQTSYSCEKCNISVCPTPCFDLLHKNAHI